MNLMESVVEILKNEYGIDSPEQLVEAVSKLGLIDLALFCAEIPKEKEIAS